MFHVLYLQSVEALCYRPDAHGFDPHKVNYSNISSDTITLGLTEPLIEMGIRVLLGEKRGRRVNADSPTTICESTL
jgi:hypothetical protein